ncbi:MAG: class I SAM-dependent methyltransferase [Cyclobacteriaceae bacterium]|nr:class I SAM-dependent methyltransferase [Cyclobacteriaceae bacterium]
MKEFWDERYRASHFIYGEEPNIFFKEQIDKRKEGKILLPAEGEGRNAVYAASRGWQVHAFDQSREGRNKAMHLAQKNNVKIEYHVGDMQEVSFPEEYFDVIALIYAHFSSVQRSSYHQRLLKYLKKDGLFILEAFSKNHRQYQLINEKAGGPKDEDMLYTTEDIKNDFSALETVFLQEHVTELKEGLYHQGKSSVIRYGGQKFYESIRTKKG